MELEQDRTLLFPDGLIKKSGDDVFVHTVYRRPTHLGPSQHAESEHHSAQKLSHMSVLIMQGLFVMLIV
jgi:hypothetical protein